MKLMLISMDVLIGSQLAFAGILFILACVSASQDYFATSVAYRARALDTILVSQQVSAVLDSSGMNVSAAQSLAQSISSGYGLRSELVPYDGQPACSGAYVVCRFLTVSGAAFLLIVSR
ncbi:Uncharacterised protein [uncultured archaeon]|nr:Uncharacterised protein [uncultured archaeon]